MSRHGTCGRHRRPTATPPRRPTRPPRLPGPRRSVLLLVVAALVGSLGVVAVPPTAGATVDLPQTYVDFSYDTAVKRPSENKPQSKLWWADGSWWGLLVSQSDDRVHIFELRGDHTWRDTGVLVDSRLNSTGDALWDAGSSTLTVASRLATSNLQVNQFRYDSATRSWTAAAGFPEVINSGGGSESATIDRDTTGRFWVTYTRASRVWVAHSDPAGHNWTAGFLPNVPDVAIKSDDISALIAYDGQIGLMWSDQASDAFRFARHQDGAPDNAWVVEDALSGPDLADDHINLKGLVGDPQGRLFAAIKTSQDTYGPSATLVGVLVRTPRADGTGSWHLAPAGTVADDHTRPIIMIDSTNQELYFFATAPVSGGDIYYKKAPLSNISFGPGRGQKFIDAQPVVNNASGAKEPVTAETGLVVLAVAEGRKLYVHGEMELAGGTPAPPDEEDPTAPTGLEATATTARVDLTWTASTDNVDVTHYQVFRDGNSVGTPSTASFSDTGVTAGATYSYTVQAFDAAGNSSPPSEALVVTVPDEPPPGTGEGITLRSTATAANSSATTVTVPAPTTTAGDVLIATVDYRGQSAVTTPAGWTLLRFDTNGTAMRKGTYLRTATTAEPAQWTWTFGAKPAAVASILAYSGVATSGPVESVDGTVTTKSTAITAPSVTTTSAGDMVVGLFGVARAAAITPPPQMTERTQVASPAGVTYPMTAETADVLEASPVTTPAFLATASVSGPNIGHTVVLRAQP